MFRKAVATTVCLVCLFAGSGCLGRFAANQGRRQAARSADYYVRTYVEPELEALQGGDPQASSAARQARNELADTIVRTGNDRQQGRVGVNDRGYLTEER